MTLQTRIKDLRDVLLKVTSNTYHYYTLDATAPYIIWAEDGENESFDADNHKEEQVIHGSIHYYTQTEFDSTVDTIQTKLNTLEPLAWKLVMIEYEEDTNLIHYEWEFNLG